MDKGNILEVEPIEVADELNEWVVIQKSKDRMGTASVPGASVIG